MSFLRLRQLCLAAPELEPAVDDFSAIFGTPVCFRDPNLADYGLHNAIFRVGLGFIEVVSPTRPGTAAQRFLDQRGGQGGYMIIFDCDNVGERLAHGQGLGIRVAQHLHRDHYTGVQFHPRDTGATMIEFNQTEGGAAIDGPYHPAGPRWQACGSGEVRELGAVIVRAPQPEGLAQRWAALMQCPLVQGPGAALSLELDVGEIRFAASDAQALPAFTGFELLVADAAGVRARAQARGSLTADGAIRYGGVDITLRE